MQDQNLFTFLRAHFPSDRSRPFIETEEGRVVTYRDLESRVDRYALFLERSGLRTGDRVAVQTEKSPEVIFLYLACVKAGLVYLPLNMAYEREELRYFVGDAEPRLFVASPERESPVRELAVETGGMSVLTLDGSGGGSLTEGLAHLEGGHRTVEASGEDVTAILYTSGTTGRPKGAMLTHGNLSTNAATLARIWGFREDDVLLHALPIYHVHGLFVATHCVLLSGSSMLFLPRFDAGKVAELLPRATVMMGVPTHYTRLLGDPRLTGPRCASMRLFISGSAPLLEETHEAFRSRTGHAILERYGMSEAGMITSNPLEGERKPGTVGFPIPDVEVRIIRDDGHEAAAGEVGELEMRGPNVFKGYWRQEEKTKAEFTPDGFFKSGDLASADADGRVSIVGRSKDLIITGGLNVYPKEVERCIEELEGVEECAVVGLPDPDFGERVAAAVKKSRAGTDLTETHILDALDGKLAGFKRPKQVYFVDELPRNAMGKVQKNVLRDKLIKAP